MSIAHRCAECGRELTGWNEAEARREFEKMWPNTPIDGAVLDKVCIECHEKLLEHICQ